MIGEILTPLLMASLLVVPALLMRRAHTNYRVAVLDQTGDSALYERAAGLLTAENANADFHLRRQAVSETEFEIGQQELKRQISEGTLDCYVATS